MENRELHPNLQAALQLVEGIFQKILVFILDLI